MSDNKLSVKNSEKEAKAAEDSNSRKRPESAFFIFMHDFRKMYKESHPYNKSLSAVGKAGNDKWKSMTDEEKAPYEARAQKQKEEYKLATSSASSSATSQSVSKPSNVQSTLKRNSKDVGWNYGILVDCMNMDKIQCIKCGKIMSGGIYRLKEHISHITGNVVPCPKASKEDQAICRNAIIEAKFKRRKNKDESEELRSTFDIHKHSIKDEVHGDQLQESLGATKSCQTVGPMDKFVSAVNFESSLGFRGSRLPEQNLNDALFNERTETVKEIVFRWVYEAGIPFNSIELDSFKLMVEAIGQFGSGFVPPTRYEITVPYLKKEVARTTDMLKKHEEEWKIYGCSILTDVWSDRKGSIVNLCANSRLGTVFLSYKHFSNIACTSDAIFEYVDKCIENVGPNNVVQVITDNSSNNMDASKLLKKKRPNIFWTSCAAHTINIMLEEIAKQSRFKKVIDRAKALTVFLYAHHKVLDMMRSYTKKRDIVRPGVTQFASSFLTLESLHDKKTNLKMMFGSQEWEECKFSNCAKGKMAYLTVMSLGFWEGVTLYLQVFTPLIKVLRIAHCDRKPSMGFLYGELLRAKEEVKAALNNVPKTYESIIQVIDEKMKGTLDSPLHLMAYGLNPYYHYKNPLHFLDRDVSLGVIECLEVLFLGDDDMQVKILMEELPKYKNKTATFEKSNVAKACSSNDTKFDPVEWWSNFGAVTPNLQRLAMRILSLTTSSLGCERNWSIFDGVYARKKNRLNESLVNNLVFIQFNARLMSNRRERERNDADVLCSHDATNAQEWITDEIDNDDDDDEEEYESRTPKYRIVRELYDEFESEDEEVNEDEIERCESDGGGMLQDLNV